MPTSSGSRSERARESPLRPERSRCCTGVAVIRRADAHGRIRARMSPDPLDLHHLGRERVIGSYLLETVDGPALFDCGPSTCLDRLQEELAGRGLQLRDVRLLLLSHIHLDHAGAAGVLVRLQPALQVYVSEIGAPHLV